MSAEVAEDPVANQMDEEEPSLVEDGDDADNDESTVGSAEQERRERRRSKRKTKKRREEDSDDDTTKDDDTYFSTSNETNKKKEDGVITKAIDRFVDLLNPVEKELDDDTLVSEATNGTTPTLTKEAPPKPSLMQRLDKHVLTRFGCSSNPAYIPEDQAVETPLDPTENAQPTTDAKSTEGESMYGGDVSTYGANSILQVDDPGDPDVQLSALDEEGNSSEEDGDGPRAFFCGAVPLKGEKGDSNVMSEIAEEKKTDDEQAKGIMYSPSQLEELEELPFDQQPPKPAEPEPKPETQPEAPAEKGVFGTLTENITPIFANIRSNLFPQGEGDQSASKAEGDAPASDTADAAVVEGETIFEEAVIEGHEVPAKDNEEPSEEGEEVPAILEGFARQESEMPFDQESDEAAKSEEEEEEAIVTIDDAEAEKEQASEDESPTEETPKEEAPEEPKVEEPKKEEPELELNEAIEVPAPVSFPSTDSMPAAKSKKAKKKKKSIIGRMFQRKSKKDKAPKESILADDEQKDISPSEQLIIPDEPEPKEARPVAPVDPTVTNKSKRESWQNSRKESASKQELDASIQKTDSADFDVLLTKTSSTKNAANDEWDKLASPSTPTKSRPEGSSASPAGVTDFPTGGIEI